MSQTKTANYRPKTSPRAPTVLLTPLVEASARGVICSTGRKPSRPPDAAGAGVAQKPEGLCPGSRKKHPSGRKRVGLARKKLPSCVSPHRNHIEHLYHLPSHCAACSNFTSSSSLTVATPAQAAIELRFALTASSGSGISSSKVGVWAVRPRPCTQTMKPQNPSDHVR